MSSARCPICGQAVLVFADDDGTTSYEPAAADVAALDALDAAARRQLEQIDQLRTAITDIATTPHELGVGGRLAKARAALQAAADQAKRLEIE